MRQGDVSAEDYARALLGEAKRLEQLNVFSHIEPDTVLEAARLADKARQSGQSLGILHGLPVPVKDSINTATLPTSCGTAALKHFRPVRDAEIVRLLKAQGAIVMGKTGLHEISMGWTSNNEITGPVRNPYDMTYVPGGSSGGSAAVVAARIAPLAVGGDTLGSIRVPASCCGVVGFRPTFGRYSSEGSMPLTDNKFDQVGPFARSVADLLLFDAAVTAEAASIAPGPPKGTRIGIVPSYFQEDVDREIQIAFHNMLESLREAGVVIVEVNAPAELKEAAAIGLTIMTYEMVANISRFLREYHAGVTFDQILSAAGQGTQRVLKSRALAPNRPSDTAYQAMLAKRDRLKSCMYDLYKDHAIDALAFPAIGFAPPQIGEESVIDINGSEVSLPLAMAHNVAPGSCCGSPGLVLPVGLSSNGLPIGVEFDALPGNDRGLLGLGLSLEKSLGQLKPPSL